MEKNGELLCGHEHTEIPDKMPLYKLYETRATQNLDNVHKKSPRLQAMPGNRKGAFNTMLLHLRLTCITFMAGQLITFSVKLYYTYGGVSYYIYG